MKPEVIEHEFCVELTLISTRQPGFGYITCGKSMSESNPKLICVWYWKHPTRKGETAKIELGEWHNEYMGEMKDYLISQAMLNAMKLGFSVKGSEN